MDLVRYLDYGVAALAIAALVVVTSWFISFIKKQEDNFSKIIQNHLHDEAEILTDLKESNIKMIAVLENLITLLGGRFKLKNKDSKE